MTYDSGSVMPFRALALSLVAALGLVPLVPAEHVHETEVNGHFHTVVHHHSQPHAIGHLPVGPDHRRVFDHPDDPVLTLSTVYTTPTLQLPALPAYTVVAVIQPLRPEARQASNRFIGPLIHGPPRPRLSLRGPPASPSDPA